MRGVMTIPAIILRRVGACRAAERALGSMVSRVYAGGAAMSRATILVGTREIVVDTTPLRGGGANFRTHVLSEPGERQLVLRPGFGFRLFAGIFLVMGCVPMAIGGAMWSAHGRDTGVWVLGGFGLLFLTVGLLLLLAPRR